MDKDLSGATPQVAEAKLTSEKKVAEPTTPKVEPTIRTYTQKELDEAVGKGRSSTQSQLSLSQAEARKAVAEVEQHKAQIAARDARIQAMQKEVEEALADDPERRQAYVSKIASLQREQGITQREAEIESKRYEFELKEHNLRMAVKAKEVMEKTSIPLEQLEGSITEEELEVKGLRFQLTKEPAEKTPKFDSAIPSGGGLSDDEFERKMGSGELDMTSENFKRSKEIMDKRLRGG